MKATVDPVTPRRAQCRNDRRAIFNGVTEFRSDVIGHDDGDVESVRQLFQMWTQRAEFRSTFNTLLGSVLAPDDRAHRVDD